MPSLRTPRIAAAVATLTAAALVPLTVAPASAAPVGAPTAAAAGAVVETAPAARALPAASRSTVRWIKVDRAKVTTQRDRSSRVVARPDDGTRVVVVGRSAKLLQVRVAGTTGWVGKKAVTTTRLKDVGKKRWTTGRVKVTAQIGKRSRTVAHVALGTEVKRLARTTGRDTNRIKVRIPGGRTGWVSANQLTKRNVWRQLAQCESGGRAGINTGNGYYGMYQFTARTWRSVGGRGLPHRNSAAEQTKRAQILQDRAGWGQWPHCTRKLGLR